MRFWDALLERYLRPARNDLGEAAAERAWAAGGAVPFDEAIDEGLAAAGRGPGSVGGNGSRS